MTLGLEDKVVLVVGASKGLGRASAEAVAAAGALVVTSARSASDMEPLGGGAMLDIPADLRDPSTPDRLVDATLDRFGRIDAVIVSGGGPPPGLPLGLEDNAIRDAFDLVTLPQIRLARRCVDEMAPQGWGRIVLIASTSIKQPKPKLVASAMARTAVFAWVKTAAQELVGTGVTINVLCPGPHSTDRMREVGVEPGRSVGDPGAFGEIAAFFCSEAAAFVSGTALAVDGGETAAML